MEKVICDRCKKEFEVLTFNAGPEICNDCERAMGVLTVGMPSVVFHRGAHDLEAQNAKLRDRLIVMDFKRHVLHKTSRERCCDEQCMANAKLLWGDVNPSYDDMQEWYAALERNDMNRARFNGETEKP